MNQLFFSSVCVCVFLFFFSSSTLPSGASNMFVIGFDLLEKKICFFSFPHDMHIDLGIKRGEKKQMLEREYFLSRLELK